MVALVPSAHDLETEVAAGRGATQSVNGLESTYVLIAGSGEPHTAALRRSLRRAEMGVEVTSLDALVDAVKSSRPNALVLVGDAAEDGGKAVQRLLEDSELVVPPIIIFHDAFNAAGKTLTSFAVQMDRSSDPEELSFRVARAIKDSRSSRIEVRGSPDQAALERLTQWIGREQRAGLLRVAKPGDAHALWCVAASGARSAASVHAQMKWHLGAFVSQGESLEYEFLELRQESTHFAGEICHGMADSISDLSALRVLLVDDDAYRARTLRRLLKEKDAEVTHTKTTDTISALRRTDTNAVIVDWGMVESPEFHFVRSMLSDVQGRWTDVIWVPWADLDGALESDPLVQRTIACLAHIQRRIAHSSRELEQVGLQESFRMLGPSGFLRAVAGYQKDAQIIRAKTTDAEYEIEVENGVVQGAQKFAHKSLDECIGTPALTAFLSISEPRLDVSSASGSSDLRNILAPVHEAILAASLDLDESHAPVHIAMSDAIPANISSDITEVLEKLPAAPALPLERDLEIAQDFELVIADDVVDARRKHVARAKPVVARRSMATSPAASENEVLDDSSIDAAAFLSKKGRKSQSARRVFFYLLLLVAGVLFDRYGLAPEIHTESEMGQKGVVQGTARVMATPETATPETAGPERAAPETVRPELAMPEIASFDTDAIRAIQAEPAGEGNSRDESSLTDESVQDAFSDALARRADRLLRGGHIAAAESTVRESFEFDRHNPQAMIVLAKIMLQTGRADEALPRAERAARMRPKRASYRDLVKSIQTSLH